MDFLGPLNQQNKVYAHMAKQAVKDGEESWNLQQVPNLKDLPAAEPAPVVPEPVHRGRLGLVQLLFSLVRR